MRRNEIQTTSLLSISEEFAEKLYSDNLVLKIHSIYNQVLNLVDQQNQIYSIVLKGFDDFPAALKINSVLSFKDLGISSDDEIIVNAKTIKIVNKLLINLKGIDQKNRIWSSKLNSLSNINEDKIKYNLIKSADILSEKSNFRGAAYFYLSFYNNLKNTTKNNLVEKYLSEEIKENIIEADIENKNPLSIIGLGLGLTPSGDDFLTGYLGVMGIMKDEYPQNVFKDFKNKILKSDFSTTDISKAMLLNILNLKTRGKIRDFIYSVNQDFEIFNKAFKNVLTIGSTSGCDIAAGVLTAYQEILKVNQCFQKEKC